MIFTLQGHLSRRPIKAMSRIIEPSDRGVEYPKAAIAARCLGRFPQLAHPVRRKSYVLRD
jgi:hypothetical protein